MKPTRIAVIINSFNRLALLQNCLRALAEWLPNEAKNIQATIFIYDAGSNDGTIEWLKDECHIPIDIQTIDGGKDQDTSFSAGLNRAATIALEKMSELEYLLFYETDNEINSYQAIAQALHALNTEESLAACGFTVSRHDGSAAGAGMPFPKISHFLMGKKIVHRFQLEQIPYVWTQHNEAQFSFADVVFTSPLLVKHAAWTESTGLNALHYPFSDCDVDWAKRLRLAGWRMGVVKRSDVIHDNSDSLSNWSQQRALHFHRARLRYFKCYQPIRTRLLWPHMFALRHLTELLIIFLFVRNPERKAHLKFIAKNLLKSVFKSYEPQS